MTEILVNERRTTRTDCGTESLTFSAFKARSKSACNYPAYVKSGEPLPMLPYSISSSVYNSPVGDHTSSYGYNSDPKELYDVDGTAGSCYGGTMKNEREAEAYEKALAHAASQFYGRLSGVKFDVLVCAGELKQSLNLVGSTARRLTHSIKALKRLQIDEAFNALKMDGGRHRQSLKRRARKNRENGISNDEFAANTWLEMNYGWAPLLDDVHKASEKLASRQFKEPADIRVTAHSTVRYAMTPNDGDGARYIQGSGSGFVKVGIVGYYSLADSILREKQGLGLTSIGNAAWELTPYSFVVDWFLPVGDFLNALEAPKGLSYVRGCTSVKKFHSWGGTILLVGNRPASLSDSGRSDNFERTVGIPPATAILRPRSVSEALNLSNVTTSLALMRQAFAR